MSAATRDRFRFPAPSWAFALLLFAVAAWSISLAWRQFGYGLEYDEAYLLGVAKNLAEGRGYVDDGVTFLSTSETFSPSSLPVPPSCCQPPQPGGPPMEALSRSAQR